MGKGELNIFVTPLYGIGDVLMTTPAIRILKEARSEAKITYICMFTNTYEVLKGNPFVDSLVYFPFMQARIPDILKFLLSMRGRFDYSINFYPSNRKEYNILAYLIGAKNRIGNRYLRRDIFELNFLKNLTIYEDCKLHNVEVNVKLLEFLSVKTNTIPQLEIFLTPEELRKGRQVIKQGKGIKKIGIHAGTSSFKGHENKRWPKERFVDLIERFDVFDFYLFGGQDDREVNEFILRALKNKTNVKLLQGLSIREVAAVIKYLDLFVSNDSGLMHLAAAVGTPVVAIFGPTNPVLVRPWGVPYRVVRMGLDCSPCFYYSPRPLICRQNGEFKCLKTLPVSAVLDAIEDLLLETNEKHSSRYCSVKES